MSDEAIGRTTKMMPRKENTDIVLEYRLYRYFSVYEIIIRNLASFLRHKIKTLPVPVFWQTVCFSDTVLEKVHMSV